MQAVNDSGSLGEIDTTTIELKSKVEQGFLIDETSPLVKQSDAVDAVCQNYIKQINNMNFWANISLGIGAAQFILAAANIVVRIHNGTIPIDAITAQTFGQMGLSIGLGCGVKMVLNNLPSTTSEYSQAVKDGYQNYLSKIKNMHFWANASLVLGGAQCVLSLASMGITIYEGRPSITALTVQALGQMGLGGGLGIGAKIVLNKLTGHVEVENKSA